MLTGPEITFFRNAPRHMKKKKKGGPRLGVGLDHHIREVGCGKQDPPGRTWHRSSSDTRDPLVPTLQVKRLC